MDDLEGKMIHFKVDGFPQLHGIVEYDPLPNNDFGNEYLSVKIVKILMVKRDEIIKIHDTHVVPS